MLAQQVLHDAVGVEQHFIKKKKSGFLSAISNLSLEISSFLFSYMEENEMHLNAFKNDYF